MRCLHGFSRRHVRGRVWAFLGRRSIAGAAEGAVPGSRFFQLGTYRADRAVCSLAGLAVGVGLAALSFQARERLLRLQKLYECQARQYQRQLQQLRSCSLTSSLGSFDELARRLLWRDQRALGEAYHFPRASPLGVGAYGTVMLATHRRTGMERAVKCIDKRLIQPGEIEALKLTDHPHICRMVEYFETPGHLWLVMELCRGQELCERVLATQGLPEFEVARLMEQMLRATQHCHRRGRLHRDLKPENFLFTGSPEQPADELKLIDFGFAMQDGALRSRDQPAAGTTLYMSPQLLEGREADRSDDVWSLGVIFHILLTGNFPFCTNDDARFKELSQRGALQESLQAQLGSLSCSAAAAELTKSLLAWDAQDRVTIEAALEHPFLAEWRKSREALLLSPEDLYYRTARLADSCRLRKIALAALTHLAGDLSKEFERSRATFLELERLGDGAVSLEALQMFLQGSGFSPSPVWLSKVERCLTTDDGVSYTSFLAATVDDSALQDDGRLCRYVFDLLDADGDGRISAQDLWSAMDLGAEESRAAIREALKSLGTVDEDADSSLCFRGFMQLVRGSPIEEELPQGPAPSSEAAWQEDFLASLMRWLLPQTQQYA